MRYRFGEYILDAERRELTRRGETVAVEPQVFDLLVHLMRNRDRVLGRDELLAFVWSGRIVTDATIDSRIKAARQAIGDTGAAQALIRTFPRKGVRFVGPVVEQDGEPHTGAPAPRPEAPVGERGETGGIPGSRRERRTGERPSVVVLPFANLSGAPEQEYFADGLVEEIITTLSRWRWFHVIGRNASFRFKGQSVDNRRVAGELGVGYILEGSVRNIGQRVRVTAQLIEAEAGTHLWADRFEGALDDIFELQDQITRRIAAAIEPTLADVEGQRAASTPIEHRDAWSFYLSGLWHFNHPSATNRKRAVACFERAIELDSGLVHAHVGLSRIYHGAVVYGLSTDRAGDLARAMRSAKQALELSPDDASAWFTLAMAAATSGDSGTGLTAARKSVELNPNYAWGHFALAVASLYDGEPAAAIASADTALQLNPNDPHRFLWLAPRASALYLLGRYEEAAAVASNALSFRYGEIFHRFPTALRVLAASYARLGREKEAKAAVAEMITSGGSERTIADAIRPFRRETDRAHYAEALRKAGLPEG